MEQEILNRIAKQEELLEKVYVSAEKTRIYFKWTLIASLVFFILPLIGLILVIPFFMSTMSSGLLGL
ncbi:MAG: hypothetical protein AAB628_01900 [Patescibacteria group bacterium]|mgnify:CR=1